MRSTTAFLILTLLLFLGCEQAPPTTLEEEPYSDPVTGTEFTIEILTFDFDYLSRQFFFSIAISNLPENAVIHAELMTSGLTPVSLGPLNDSGLNGDIQVNDGHFDGNWSLPDSQLSFVDSSWTLAIYASTGDASATQSLRPQKPLAPVIQNVSHQDTLILISNGLVVDTLHVSVTHSNGLDEIRDLSMMSLKPDGNYANEGLPIPLYDDGGTEVFFTFDNVDYTSGDSLAGDGIYSLLLILTPTNLAGTYHWTFTARSWLGIDSESVLDSVVVLPAPTLQKASRHTWVRSGVFQ